MNKEKLDEVLATVKEQITSAPESQRAIIFAGALTDIWGEDLGKAMGVLEFSRKSVFTKARNSSAYADKLYLTRELHEWLYECVLSTGMSIQEASKVAVNTFEVTLTYLNESRTNIHARNRMKEVVSVFDDHIVQKGMIKKGIVTKRELQNHRTPTGQLTRLGQGVKLYKTLTDLEARVSGSEDEIKDTKSAMSIVEEQVQVLNQINDTDIGTPRKIVICRENGLTQKKTADKLGVSLSTVKRSWNDE